MSGPRVFLAEVAGIAAEVIQPQGLEIGGVGIGTSAITCNLTGEPLLAITIRGPGGELLTAILDEEKIFRLADMMADFIEGLPRIGSEARH